MIYECLYICDTEKSLYLCLLPYTFYDYSNMNLLKYKILFCISLHVTVQNFVLMTTVFSCSQASYQRLILSFYVSSETYLVHGRHHLLKEKKTACNFLAGTFPSPELVATSMKEISVCPVI